MRTFYRIAKSKHPLLDGAGAFLFGGRWNSPGRHVIYGSTCLAGCLLEVLVHAGQRQKLPGDHLCVRAHIPEDLAIDVVDGAELVGWDAEESPVARAYGDAWLGEGRSAVLLVPAAVARPYGRHILLNPHHPDYTRLRIDEPVPIGWDARLFRM